MSELIPAPLVLKKKEQEISEAQTEQALGRSKGGFTTKIHAAVDALGNPIRLILTHGQATRPTTRSPIG